MEPRSSLPYTTVKSRLWMPKQVNSKNLTLPLKHLIERASLLQDLPFQKTVNISQYATPIALFVSLRKIICQLIQLNKSQKNGNSLERCFLTRLRSLILLSVMISMTRVNFSRDFSLLVRIEGSLSMMSMAPTFLVWMLSVNSKLSKKLSHQLVSGIQRKTQRKVSFWLPTVSTKWKFGTQALRVQERPALVQPTVIESPRWKNLTYKVKKSPILFTLLLKRLLVWSKCLSMEIPTRPWVS